MQTYAGDVLKTLKALHDMSCTRLWEFSTDCGHELHREHLTQCHVPVPMELQLPLRSKNLALSEDSNVLLDMPLTEEEPEQGKPEIHEEPEIHEAEHGHTDVQEGMKKPNLTGFDNNESGTNMDIRINQYCHTSRTEW